MRARGPELHDYDAIRASTAPLAITRPVRRPILVLGSTQDVRVLHPVRTKGMTVLWRRGGGGVVWLRPGDLWVDFWIPAGDLRGGDLVVTAAAVGEWWRSALQRFHPGPFEVHAGPLADHGMGRAACFAAEGPGEVTVGEKKVVGLTQWRVREGALCSTVLHQNASSALARLLWAPPEGLAAQLDHASLVSLQLTKHADALVAAVIERGGEWRRVVSPPAPPE